MTVELRITKVLLHSSSLKNLLTKKPAAASSAAELKRLWAINTTLCHTASEMHWGLEMKTMAFSF